jgi:hypothetical protein
MGNEHGLCIYGKLIISSIVNCFLGRDLVNKCFGRERLDDGYKNGGMKGA